MRLRLIDGNSFLHRMYHAIPPLSRSDGQAVNAIWGLCHVLWPIARRMSHTHAAVVWDAGRSEREKILPSYKSERGPKAPELVSQYALARAAVEAFGIANVEIKPWEADDVIASLATVTAARREEVVIHTGDKDLWHLLKLPQVKIVSAADHSEIGPDQCARKFGVVPSQFVDYLALVGDATDGIPGVPRIGAKTAAALLRDHATLDRAIEVSAKALSGPLRTLRSNVDVALQSRELARLRTDVPVPAPADLARQPLGLGSVIRFLGAMEFEQLSKAVIAEVEGGPLAGWPDETKGKPEVAAAS